MISLTPDKTIKIEYNPQINKYAFPVNAVGAHAQVVLTEPDYTDTDANTIYVSASTGDDGNPGTFASPKETLVAAIEACTEVKTRVVIIDSSIYSGELNYTNVHFQRMFKETGQTPIVCLRDLGYTPSDANSIFVKKTGSDANAGTQAAPKLTLTGATGALSACDGTHQNIVFLDSGTYDETGWEITGNKLNYYAYYGCAPVLNMSKNYSQTEYTAVKAETVYHNAAIVSPGGSIINLNDDRIMFLYSDSADGAHGKYIILDSNDYSTIKAETTFNATATYTIRGIKLTSGNILITYYESATTSNYYIELSPADYSVSIAETIIPTASQKRIHGICQQSNGNIVAVGNDLVSDTNGFYAVFSSAMALITDWTSFGSVGGTGPYISCDVFSNNNILIAYRHNTDTFGKYLILSGTDFSSVKAETTFAAMDISHLLSAIVREDDAILLCYGKKATGKMYRLLLSSVDYSTLHAEYEISAEASDDGCFATMAGEDVFVSYKDNAATTGKYFIFRDLYQTFLVSGVSNWNGLTITTSTPDYINKVFDLTQNLTLCWCTIHGFEAPQTDLITYTAHGSFKVDTNNCDIHDNDAGFYLTCNTVTIEDSLFYRLGKSYAIYINGAAAALGNITLEHLSIYNNYRGIELENNNGTNEVIKNCIFSANNNYGLKAETTITLTYAILLDATSGVTQGTGVILANPLYVNDGLVDEDDTDLHLKLKVLGYVSNSPAYNAADDSRDLGAYWCEYVGEQTTWDSITLTKPEVIPIKREYSGAVNIQLADGSYDSYKESQSELVELKWKGVTNADFDYIDEMWCASKNGVRVYFNPTTSPATYFTFTMLRQPMNAGVENWLIDSVAKQDVSIFLARSYEHV